MTSYNAKVEKGDVKIDVETLFYSLDDVAKSRVAKALAFDQRVVECVVKWLVKGRVEWDNPKWDAPGHDDEDNDWWCSSGAERPVLEEIRLKLLTSKDELVSKLIGDLLDSRNFLSWERDEYRKLCWDLERRWHDKESPNSRTDYYHTPARLTREQVAEWIKRREAEVEARRAAGKVAAP